MHQSQKIVLSKSKSVKFYWFQCYTYNYINQWYICTVFQW